MKTFDEIADISVIGGENLLIIDSLNLCFRFRHRKQKEFSAEFVRTVASLAKSYNACHVVILSDYKGSDYRKGIDPNYKGNRKEKYKDQTEEEAEAFKQFFNEYNRTLTLAADTFPVIKLKGVEADDSAAYIVDKYSVEYKHVWLISTDRDWSLLLRHNVSRWSYVSRKEYALDNFFAEHQCDSPEQYVSLKVLTGDAGDNIIGIKGIGPKRAYGLLKKYGSAMDLLEYLPVLGNQKFIAELNASESKILLNYQLVDLLAYCREAITYTNPDNLNHIDNLFKEFKQ